MLLQKTIGNTKHKPYQETKTNASILFDNTCLFKCKHCFLWDKKLDFDKLSLNNWILLLEGIYSEYNSNVKISLGGDGMALTDEMLIPIIKKCNELGFETELATNGYLINRFILNKIIESGLNKIIVSLDYFTKQKHDTQRGIIGSYDHVIRVLNVIKEYSIKVHVNCIIMKPNLSEINGLVKIINSINSDITINFQAIVQPFNTAHDETWYNNKKFRSLWPDKNVLEVINDIIKLKLSGYNIGNNVDQLKSFQSYFENPQKCVTIKCNVKDVSLHIYSNGRLQKCNYMGDIGIIKKDNSFKDLLYSDQYKKIIDKMKGCNKNCILTVNCNYEKNET